LKSIGGGESGGKLDDYEHNCLPECPKG